MSHRIYQRELGNTLHSLMKKVKEEKNKKTRTKLRKKCLLWRLGAERWDQTEALGDGVGPSMMIHHLGCSPRASQWREMLVAAAAVAP